MLEQILIRRLLLRKQYPRSRLNDSLSWGSLNLSRIERPLLLIAFLSRFYAIRRDEFPAITEQGVVRNAAEFRLRQLLFIANVLQQCEESAAINFRATRRVAVTKKQF